MAKLRYVKTLEQVKAAAESNPEFLDSTVRSIRCTYETDPAIHRALVPKPLEPTADPIMAVTLSHVSMHISPEMTIEIGSAIFGARATYDGEEGTYLVTMPMTTEAAVIGGRETFGEPKKIADISFDQEGDQVKSVVTRMGIPYLGGSGTSGADQGAREFTEAAFCYKAMPSCDQGKAFDNDPLLVRLEWNHKQKAVHTIENGQITLNESPFDPVADVPVRSIVKMEYEVGNTASNGKVLRSVPGEWLLPFLHQRYDDPSGVGIEV